MFYGINSTKKRYRVENFAPKGHEDGTKLNSFRGGKQTFRVPWKKYEERQTIIWRDTRVEFKSRNIFSTLFLTRKNEFLVIYLKYSTP